MTRSLLLPIALVVATAPAAAGQGFSWFATTMAMGETPSQHASVMVLAESVWTTSDSLVRLTSRARLVVEEARGQGVRVVASVPASVSEEALSQLWAGHLDGLIVPAGAFSGPVSRPETAVVLSADLDAGTLDGALTKGLGHEGDWEQLDSTFARRAPTMDDPIPAREVVLVSPDGPIFDLLAPGTILLPSEVPQEWATVLTFRAAHPAIAGGIHERLDNTAYVFYRGKRMSRDETDEVVVVLGAKGRTTVKVSSVFADDTLLREVHSGGIALVAYGQVTFHAGDSGILLLEVIR